MKEYSNTDTYGFISEELTYHLELPQYSAEELAAHKGDKDFWYELEDKLDCFRICDVCGEPMLDGFLVDGARHFCSEECLHKVMTDEEYMEYFKHDDNDTFWTTWWDNSQRYNKQIA